VKTIRHALLSLWLAFYSSLGIAGQGPQPDPVTDSDFYDHGQAATAKAELGMKLFYDKLLSVNRNISCAETCRKAYPAAIHWRTEVFITAGIAPPFHDWIASGLEPGKQVASPSCYGAVRLTRFTTTIASSGIWYDGRPD
jgi:cytochrome c peroxidase